MYAGIVDSEGLPIQYVRSVLKNHHTPFWQMTDNDRLYHFDDFLLDAADRQLWHYEQRIHLNARYFDALALLVQERGQLVAKDRFFSEVWNDVVVSDSALSQCIKEIRQQLGDDASNPRFIETVPRHGYRFIADVRTESASRRAPIPVTDDRWRHAAIDIVAGTLGGGLAGVFGGFLYGLGLAPPTGDAGLGALSVLLVMIGLNVFVGLLGGFGISSGMAVTGLVGRRWRRAWLIPGAAFGGMFVGGASKLLGVDAFSLLLGFTPAGITGGVEGATLGAALAAGILVAGGVDAPFRWRPVLGASAAGGLAGVLIPLAGGHLMGGSLQLLANAASSSRLQLGTHLGEMTQVVLGGLEGLLFGAGVAGALVLARVLRQRRV